MPLDPSLFPPLADPRGRRAVMEVHDRLRSLILSGRLPPGAILSQVELARLLGVSRTPVREALRLLQEAALISAEPNFRSRVLGFDTKEVEALYLRRMLLEAAGVAITAARATPAQLAAIGEVVRRLESEEAHDSFEAWLTLHREFHRLIVAGAGDALAADLATLALRSERYQSAYKGAHLPGWWMRGEVEHRRLYEAIAAGDAATASDLAARHLARTALELLAALAPEYDTTVLRLGLRFATTGSVDTGRGRA